jgi:diguanylate cyclase (GGDEF)-like protein/PAS domain S-box-containing protein
MSLVMPSLGATFLATIVLTIVYWYIYSQYRERYMYFWILAWFLYSIRLVFDFLMLIWPDQMLLLITQQTTNLISGLLFVWGTYVFVGKPMSRIVIVGFALDYVWILTGLFMGFSRINLNLPTFIFTGIIFIWTGIIFIRSKEFEGLGKYLAAWGFIFWGIYKIDYPFIKEYTWFLPWGYLIAAFLEIVVALGVLLMYFEKTRKVLSTSEQRFRMLAENAQDLIYRYKYAPVKGYEYVSPSSTAIIGYTPEEHYADPDLFLKVIHPDDRVILKDLNLISGVNRIPISLRTFKKNGEIVWTEHRNVPIVDESGNILGFEGIARNITARKQVEEALEKYKLLSEHAGDIMLFFRLDGQIIEANEAAVKLYSYSKQQILQMNIRDLRAPETKQQFDEHIALAEKGTAFYETYHSRKDETVFPVEVSLQSAILGNEKVLIGIVRDITERKRAQATINHLAYHDVLTGLANRTLFYDRLTMEIARAHRSKHMMAIMFLDLDRFKYVNDMMGHAVGDMLLTSVGQKLKDCVRTTDTVARIGGDEFTIFLPEISRGEDAAKVAQKIISVLREPWKLSGGEFQITASIGIVLYPNDGENIDTLIKNADTAMYRAKEKENNYQFYTPDMNAKAVERMEMELALRKAYEQGNFILHYQPQVNISTGNIIGVEVLIRWQHPEKGMILPLEFIQLAEETGLIVPIGEWVLRTACKQSKAWQVAGFKPIILAVNISACQFSNIQLVEKVSEILDETGLNPSVLELEITESTAMKDVDFSVAMLKKLREMGINIAIDDFGTGYSSLNYLKRFPITTLKIDRSFVRDVMENPEDAAIVSTIIVLAKKLKFNVIVEGIETCLQKDFFLAQGCTMGQGYLYSKPVTEEEFEKLMRKSNLYNGK